MTDADRIAALEAALRPFAEIHERWGRDRDSDVDCVRRGGEVSKLVAVALSDVIRARDALALAPRLSALEI